METYYSKFVTNNLSLDDLTEEPLLKEGELEAIGVTKFGDKRKLAKHIAKLSKDKNIINKTD